MNGSASHATTGWRFWLRQIRAMLGLEARRTFLRARALPVVFVALMPVFLLGARALVHAVVGEASGIPQSPAPEVAQVYGVVFQLFFLRLVVFFCCFGIFTYLSRGEILERSLHFYWLSPMRREVYVAGKYVAGVIAAGALLSASVVAQVLLNFLPSATRGGAAYLFAGPGLGQLFAYFGVTWLAVLGYGAVFLTLGLTLRNPMIPAALILGWEWMNFLLPPVLKKISVIHHLQSLCPIPVPKGPFALPAEPTPAPLAILGLLAVAAVLLGVAARRARKIEVLYAGD